MYTYIYLSFLGDDYETIQVLAGLSMEAQLVVGHLSFEKARKGDMIINDADLKKNL